jgi:hypothetical protein
MGSKEQRGVANFHLSSLLAHFLGHSFATVLQFITQNSEETNLLARRPPSEDWSFAATS